MSMATSSAETAATNFQNLTVAAPGSRSQEVMVPTEATRTPRFKEAAHELDEPEEPTWSLPFRKPRSPRPVTSGQSWSW